MSSICILTLCPPPVAQTLLVGNQLEGKHILHLEFKKDLAKKTLDELFFWSLHVVQPSNGGSGRMQVEFNPDRKEPLTKAVAKYLYYSRALSLAALRSIGEVADWSDEGRPEETKDCKG